jgi:hypothetical protein
MADINIANLDAATSLADADFFHVSKSGLDKKITVANAYTSLVKLTGDQTIAGVKTFSSFPITPSSAPTTDYQVANRKFVVDTVGTGYSRYEVTGNYTITDSDGYTDIFITTGSSDRTVLMPTLADNLNRRIRVFNAGGFRGTATSGGANTLTDTGSGWTVNEWTSMQAWILKGTGAGQVRNVASNTSEILTVSNNWDTNPDSTSIYVIVGKKVTVDGEGTELLNGELTRDITGYGNSLDLFGMSAEWKGHGLFYPVGVENTVYCGGGKYLFTADNELDYDSSIADTTTVTVKELLKNTVCINVKLFIDNAANTTILTVKRASGDTIEYSYSAYQTGSSRSIHNDNIDLLTSGNSFYVVNVDASNGVTFRVYGYEVKL